MSYNPKVLDHFRNPKNMGRMRNPDGVGKVGNVICVLPDTNVHINSKTVLVSTLKKDNRVLSHDGKYHKIKSISRRLVDEEVFSLKNKFGEIFLTSDHMVLGVKVPRGRHFSYTRRKKRFSKDPFWFHVSELNRGDLIAYPILKETDDIGEIRPEVKRLKPDFKSRDIPEKIKINSDFLRLAGYYLSGGCLQDKVSRMRLGFVFNSKEEGFIKDVCLLIERIFGLKPKIEASKKTATRIYANNALMVRLFKRLFGKGAEEKHIPQFIMTLPPEKQKELVLGMWRGDGFFSARRRPRAGYSTVSYQLAQQLKILLLRQGIIPSIYIDKAEEKDGARDKKFYRIHVGERSSLEKLAKILGAPFSNKKGVRVHSWIEKGYAFLPITKVEKFNYQGEVYNLEVDQAKSFTSDAAALHNCGDIMWLYLKVAKNKKGEEVIADVKFETFGCVAAIATSSIITELAKGKTLKEALAIDRKKIVSSLGGLPPVKTHCSVLAADALAEAVYDYLTKNKRPVPEELERRHQRIEEEREMIEEKYKGWIKREKSLKD